MFEKMKCQNKVAIVTGAAGDGIGRSTALTLAREGAKVVINYRTNFNGADGVLRHLQEYGVEGFSFQADVNEESDCKSLIDASMKKFGRIDICIIGPGGGWHPQPIESLDTLGALDDAQKELAPLYNLLPLLLPGMYERNWGRIIGLSMDLTKLSPSFAYNAAKAARNNALLMASNSTWQHDVTVNSICPGPINTQPDLDSAVELCNHGDAWLKRDNITPQDIAEGIALLCSEEGRFLNGCELRYAFK